MKRRLAAALVAVLLSSSQAPSPAKAPFTRPLILVHGWGPPGLIGFRRFERFLRSDGVPGSRIHALRYTYTASLADIRAELVAQLKAVVAAYPANERFDVIGHSTGQFVVLDALLSAGLDGRVAKLVGLSGIAHGWDCGACEHGFLGKAEKELSPANNAFLRDFYERYKERVAALDKCSLFSPDDGLIKPFDSGRFDDGVNVAVPDMQHMESVKTRRYYEVMKERCFQAASTSPSEDSAESDGK